MLVQFNEMFRIGQGYKLKLFLILSLHSSQFSSTIFHKISIKHGNLCISHMFVHVSVLRIRNATWYIPSKKNKHIIKPNLNQLI